VERDLIHAERDLPYVKNVQSDLIHDKRDLLDDTHGAAGLDSLKSIHIHIHIHAHVHMLTYSGTCTHNMLNFYTHMNSYMHMSIYTHTHMNFYTHMSMYTHTYAEVLHVDDIYWYRSHTCTYTCVRIQNMQGIQGARDS
jgi:hypothetical protein